MKICFYFLLIFLLIPLLNQAQNFRERHINVVMLGKDSVIMPLNSYYQLTEDSCAEIMRYARYDFQKKIFKGEFKDVSKVNPKLILAEGNYTDDGLKDGEFITHYVNGNLQSKGSFKNNKYIGKWEFYYENGTPELIFEVVGNEYYILNAWSKDSNPIVTNGKGKYYVSYIGALIWSGKIVNGRPDGTWELQSNRDDDPVMTENFKKNKFVDGENKVIHYTDSSHIVLVQTDKLPLLMAEQMLLSPYGCNTPQILLGAKYAEGIDAYTEEIKRVVLDYLNKLNIGSSYHNDFTIDGEVDEKGALTNLNSHTAQDFDRKVILQLYKLPLLQPAKINGKPVRQRFTITFLFENGYYSFKYKFLPLVVN